MTSLLLPNGPGGGKYIKSPSEVRSAQAQLYVSTPDGGSPFADIPMIVTQYTYSTRDNVQFTSTVGSSIYTQVLGRQPHSIQVHGLLYNALCDSSDAQGIPVLMARFEMYRSSHYPKPLILGIGNQVFYVLLHEITISESGGSDSPMKNFALTFTGSREGE